MEMMEVFLRRMEAERRILIRRLQQLAEESVARSIRFDHGYEHRWLALTLPDTISQSQIFPLHFYTKELKQQFGVEFFERKYPANPPTVKGAPPTAVFFQLWIDISPSEAERIARHLKEMYPTAKLIFLDPCAPTNFPFAGALNEHIDCYIKKHTLQDRYFYSQRSTIGDTNLTDWYNKAFEIPDEHVFHNSPEEFTQKVITGTSFAYAPYLLPVFWSNLRQPQEIERAYDIHARIGGAGSLGWYPKMRSLAIEALENLPPHLRRTDSGRIKPRKYLSEMRQSTACFSPFGYGEVCWRDYEAIAFGSILIKPDMSHIKTLPNVFRAWETYIPCSWDFSDLPDAVDFAINNKEARIKINNAAFDAIHNATRNHEVLNVFFAATAHDSAS